MINTESLKEWILTNNIVNRSIERYWEYIDMYISEVEDEYSNILKYIDIQLMSVKLYKASLSTIYSPKCDVINVYLDIAYVDKYIGRYEIVYNLLAEYIDEFIEFDDVNYIWRLADAHEKTLEIAKNALMEGVDLNFICKITGLSIKQIDELK